MGCSFSSARRSCRRIAYEGVRVVHVNGYVEEFIGGAVTVGHITGKSSKIMVCTSGQLCSSGFNPLCVDDRLEPGGLYFLLPHSVFQSDASPMDHAVLAARLTALAFDRATPVDIRLVGGIVDGGKNGSSGTVLGGCDRRVNSYKIRSWKPALDSIEERS